MTHPVISQEQMEIETCMKQGMQIPLNMYHLIIPAAINTFILAHEHQELGNSCII